MIRRLKNLAKNPGSRNTFIVLAGTIVNSAIGGFFFVIAPRFVGPEKYGLFAVVSSTGVLVTSLANMGIDSGILRFASNSPNSVNRVLKLAFQSYLLIGFATFVLGLFFSKPIVLFLGVPEIENLLKIAFGGVIVFLLTDFFIARLQSKQEFLKAFIVPFSGNLARLGIIIFGAYFFIIDLRFLTILFFFIPIVSLIFGKIFTNFEFLKATNHSSEFKNFFSFNFWIAASFAISAFPVDNYILLKVAGPVATGIYAAPFKLLSISDQLAGNYSRVLASRITNLHSWRDALGFISHTLPIALPVAFAFLLLAFVSSPLVSLLLGEQYTSSIPIFTIVAFASIFTFLTAIPVSLTIFFYKSPSAAFVVTLITIVLWVILNLLLIPPMGAIGAAIAYLFSEIISLLLFSSFVFIFAFRTRRVENK